MCSSDLTTLFRRFCQGPGSPSLASLARIFPRKEPLLERTSQMRLQFLLRTRLSKPGESREDFPREEPLLERAPQGCHPGFCQGPSGASRGPQASRGFLPREATSAPAAECTWDDVRDTVAILVHKAVNKAAPSQGGLRPRHFRDKENACTVGVVETRVPRAGPPGPTTLFRRFRQGPGSPSLASLARVFPREGPLPERASRMRLQILLRTRLLQAWRAS